MTPLDKIETRICVNDLPGAPDAVHVITQPGVYYLSADIVAPPGMSAILIDLPPGATEQVVLDPGGYSLRGNGGGTGSGIKLQSGPIFVLEPNVGRIAGFGSHGIEVDGAGSVSLDGATIDSCGGDGIHVVNSADVSISSFEISNCSGNGVTVVGADFMAINEKALPGRRHPKKDKKTQSRVTNVGGHGIHISDCDDGNVEDFDVRLVGGDGVRIEHSVAGAQMRLGVANGGVEQAGGNGITVLGGQTIASAIIRRIHVKETIDGLYAEDVDSLTISDWRDDDCNGSGLRVLGNNLNDKFHHISTLVSRNAGGNGVSIDLNPLADSSVVVSDVLIERPGLTGMRIYNKRKFASAELRITDAGGDGLDLDCDDVEITDAALSRNVGSGGAIHVSGALVVSGLVATGNGGAGVIGFGSGIAQTDVTNLRVHSNGFGTPGVMFDGATFVEMDLLSVRGSTFSGNSGSGLRVTDLNRDGMLDVIVCSANGSHGLVADAPSGVGSGRLVLVSGSFGSNGGDGVFLEATTGGQVVDCTMTNNSGWGFRVLGPDHLIQRNAAFSNAGTWLVGPGNITGPAVSAFNVGANSNPSANFYN